MGLGHSRNLSNKAVHNTFAASSGPPGRTEPARPLLCPGWSGKAGFRTRRSANLSRKPRDGKLGFAVLARWLVVLVGLDRFRVKLFFYSFLSFVLPRNFLVALLLRWYLFFDTQVL